MMAPVVAGMIVTDEKNAFKGLCVNNWRRRGEEDEERGKMGNKR